MTWSLFIEFLQTMQFLTWHSQDHLMPFVMFESEWTESMVLDFDAQSLNCFWKSVENRFYFRDTNQLSFIWNYWSVESIIFDCLSI